MACIVLKQKIEQLEEHVFTCTLDNVNLSAYERIIHFFGKMVEYCKKESLQKGCIFGNMTLELYDEHKEMRYLIRGFFEQLEKRLAVVVQEAAGEGQASLRGLQPEQAATSILALLQGSILLAKGRRSAEPLHDGLRMLSSMLGDRGEKDGAVYMGGDRIGI